MKKSVRYVIMVVGSAILIAAYAWIHFSAPKIQEAPKDPPLQTNANRNQVIGNQADSIYEKYQSDCDQLLADFMLLLEKQIEPDYLKAKTAIPETADRICGLQTCVRLCYKAAKDKLSDTHDFDDAFYSLLEEPIVQPCGHANEVASNELNNLNQRLKERYIEYGVALAAVCDLSHDGQQTVQPDIESYFDTTKEFLLNRQIDKIVTLFVGVPLEIILFRETIQAAIKLFVVPVARICATSSAGVISAAADGPLPFGDAIGATITVGGLIWTAYDVYSVTQVMPEQLKTTLTNEIDTAKAELVKNASEKALDLVREYRESGRAMKYQLIQSI